MRSPAVREGAVVGDSSVLEIGAEIPKGTKEQVPDFPCNFARLHHLTGQCQVLLCLESKQYLKVVGGAALLWFFC